MSTRLSGFLAMLIYVGLSSPASAAPIVWEFTGQVTHIDQSTPLDVILPVGTVVTFTATFDSAAIDLCPQNGTGFYILPGGRVSFGGSSYASSMNALEVNAPGGNCVAQPDAPQTVALRYLGFPNAPFASATVGWTGGPDIGDVMPSMFPNPSLTFFSFGYACVVCADIRGQITSVQAVPEPSTLLLTAAGIAALLSRARRARDSRS